MIGWHVRVWAAVVFCLAWPSGATAGRCEGYDHRLSFETSVITDGEIIRRSIGFEFIYSLEPGEIACVAIPAQRGRLVMVTILEGGPPVHIPSNVAHLATEVGILDELGGPTTVLFKLSAEEVQAAAFRVRVDYD